MTERERACTTPETAQPQVQRKRVNTASKMTDFKQFCEACEQGDLDKAKSLFKEGFQNQVCFGGLHSRTMLHCVVEAGHVGLTEFLLSHKPKTDVKSNLGFSAIHLAATNNHVECMAALLKVGADVEDRVGGHYSNPTKGRTALHIAADKGHHQIVKQLLDAKAKVDSRVEGAENSSKTKTPLILAASAGHVEVVKLLHEHGAKHDLRVEEGDDKNKVALHFAAMNGHLEVVKFLVNEVKVNVNVKANKTTPLQYAVSRGHIPVIDFLMHNGGDFNAKTYWGTTIIQLCPNPQVEEKLKAMIKESDPNSPLVAEPVKGIDQNDPDAPKDANPGRDSKEGKDSKDKKSKDKEKKSKDKKDDKKH